MRQDNVLSPARSVTGLNVSTGLQVAAILLISLVAGSTFGVWQGYDPRGFSAATFLAVHQGAVRGLNVLLPAMALAAIVLTLALAVMSRRRPGVLRLYVVAIALMIAGGAITRFANQPINAEVMQWTADTLPANWAALRDSWWTWHVARTFVSIACAAALVVAVFVDRGRDPAAA